MASRLKFHHVDHSGANRKYYLAVLDYIKNHPEYDVDVSISSLGEFIEKGVPDKTDALSYQTFPDENHKGKHNPAVIFKSDCEFAKFKGLKILVDTHDCGDKDAFTRMYTARETPRVKCFPSHWFLRNYNVVLLSTVSANPSAFRDKFDRIIEISCKFGTKVDGFYGHRIREEVKRCLQENYSHITNFEFTKKDSYFQELQWTKIVVGAPGWGRYNGSYWGAMKAGALLFAHRALNQIKLFPHSDIIEGEDYVGYDLFDFKIQLDRILNNPTEIERIRNNGRRKFMEGLNHKKSAEQLVQFLKEGA